MLIKKSNLRHILEFILLITVILTALTMPIFLPVRKLGFFCRDANLMYPLRPQTFSLLSLYVIVLFLPAFTIFVNEIIILKKRGRLVNRKEVKAFFLYIYEIYYILLMAAFLCKAAMEIIKFSTGRHRPNFFAYCKPINPTTRISINSTCSEGEFVENYVCTDESKEGFLSFVSGHVTFVVASFGITIIYIQYRVDMSRNYGLWKNLVQQLIFVYGCFISSTRVSEYYHHATDCIGAFFLASLFVIICTLYVKEILFREMADFSRSIEKTNYSLLSNSIQTVY